MEEKMKRIVWLMLLVGTLSISGCADVIKKADETFIDATRIPIMFNPVDPEAERMLYESMYTSPVKWDPTDLEQVLSARGTLKMAGEYLDNMEKTQGGVTFFTLREFLNFTTYAFAQYELGADGRAYQKGEHCIKEGGMVVCNMVDVLTDRERWIYERVKEDVWTNLRSLRAYVDYMAAQIDGEVNQETIARFKQAFNIVKTIIPINLPTDLDF